MNATERLQQKQAEGQAELDKIHAAVTQLQSADYAARLASLEQQMKELKAQMEAELTARALFNG